MKKLFVVLFAVLFLAGFVWAQGNNATVDQTGNLNKAEVTQSGSGISATIDQTANGSSYGRLYNEAYVDQVGTNHSVDITQSDASNHQYQFGNYAEVNQSGTHQTATIIQEGSSKHTGWPNGPVTGGAYVTQSGSDNITKIEQRTKPRYGRLTATVNQDGVNNYAEHIIEAPASRTVNASATINQTGDNNDAYQLLDPNAQIGELRKTTMSIEQQGIGGGVGNYAEQTIRIAWGHDNSTSITQIGDDNYATQLQENLNGSNNSAMISQDGEGNVAQEEQFDTSDNGTSGNTATITSTGNYNGTMADPILISQNGDNNTGTITQTGDFNAASIMQTGNGHSASIIQNGDNNSATVTQN